MHGGARMHMQGGSSSASFRGAPSPLPGFCPPWNLRSDDTPQSRDRANKNIID
jgi:hypothetical protein